MAQPKNYACSVLASRGAGGMPTASAVLGDLISAAIKSMEETAAEQQRGGVLPFRKNDAGC